MEKKTNIKKALSTVGIGALVVLVVAGSTWMVESVADAAKPKVTTRRSVKVLGTLTLKDREEMSRAAGHMLKHIYKARLAVSHKDKKKALEQVGQAIQLSRIVKKVMPRYVVETRMESGGLVYKDKDTVQPLLVPLYDELDRVDLMEPMHTAKQGRAKRVKAPGDLDVVEEVDLVHAATVMDVKWATAKLWTAKYYLDRTKWDRADENLKLSQQSVTVEEDLAPMPLAEAADNIAFARSLINKGRNKHAAVALRAASGELARYQKGADKARAKEVKALRAELDTLQKKLDNDKALSAGEKTAAANQAGGWWRKLIPWRSNDVCVANKGDGSAQCVAR